MELFLNNKIPGFSHVTIGQEAVAAGVCLALEEQDYLTCTHRGHGHCVAKGMDLKRMYAELMGKKTGFCHGKGGSMHVADFKKGVIGANGIVGGGIPIATGAALSAQIQNDGRVCACFFGDGAVAEGMYHESLNVAGLWKLPIVYVIENNLYGEWTHYSKQHSIEDLSLSGVGYGIPGLRVDGMDVLAVYRAAVEAVQRARRGDGPTLLECVTYRYFGHSIGGPKVPRPQAEIDAYKRRDPINTLSAMLIQSGKITQQVIDGWDTDIRQEVADAVTFAEDSPFPAPEEAFEDLYV